MRGIILDPNSYNGIQRLTREQKGELLDTIFIYNNTGQIPEMTDMVGMAFEMMRGFFDNQILKYKEKCDKNAENARRRWDDANACDGIEEDANACERIKKMPMKSNQMKSNEIKSNEIYDFWNLQKIIIHTIFTEGMKNKTKKQLERYDIEDIKRSIKNYGDTYRDATCYFKHKWTLEEFLSRSNALPVFFDKGPADYRSKAIAPEKKKEEFQKAGARENFSFFPAA